MDIALQRLKYVKTSDGLETGKVVSKTRRCSLEGCRGVRVGVRWPGGKLTYPCSAGMDVVTDDTWQISR